MKQNTVEEFTKELVCDHFQLSVIQATFCGREKLPAQHLSKLRPSSCRSVGEEHNILGKADICT